jgi:hypothetical protein
LRARGVATVPAYQLAFAAYLGACVLSFAWLLGWRWRARRSAGPAAR